MINYSLGKLTNKSAIYYALIIGIVTFLVYLLFLACNSTADLLYGEWLFPSFRLLFNTLDFMVPTPLFPVFIVGLTGVVVYRSVRIIYAKDATFFQKLRKWFNLLLCTVIYLMCSFYWFWGFNYLRPSPVEKLGLQLNPIPEERVFELLETWSDSLNSLRGVLGESMESYADSNFANLRPDYSKIQQGLNTFLYKHNFPAFGDIEVKYWRPGGILLRNSTAGMYFPFTGEATVDPGLHPLQLPFTATHEMGHAVGFTDEGFCNLIAWVVCKNSEDDFIRYSGYLTFWRHIARASVNLDRERYILFLESGLSEAVKSDLQSIHDNRNKYPDFFPGLQRRVYDTYLRAHGVQEGIASYSNMLMLAESYLGLFNQAEDHFN